MKRIIILFIFSSFIINELDARHGETVQNLEKANQLYKQAEKAAEKGRHKMAVDYMEQMKTLMEEEQVWTFLTSAYSKLGFFYIKKKDKTRGIDYIEQSITIGEMSPRPPKIVLGGIHLSLGDFYLEGKKYELAIINFQKAIDYQTETLGELGQVALIYIKIGEAYQHLNEFKKAVAAFEAAEKINQRIYANYNNSSVYWNLEKTHRQLGNNRTARKYKRLYKAAQIDSTHQRAINFYGERIFFCSRNRGENRLDSVSIYMTKLEKLLTESNRWGELIYMLGFTGYSYKESDYPKMFSYINQALEVTQTHLKGESIFQADIYNHLGEYYEEFLGDYNQAIESAQKALAFYEQHIGQTSVYLAQIYNNIGLRLEYKGHYEEAILYHQRALKLRDNSGDDLWSKGQSHKNLGRCYEGKGDFEAAMYHYRIMEICYLKSHLVERFSSSGYQNMGRCYNKMGEFDSAKIALQLALDWLQQRDNTVDSYYGQRIYRDLGDAYAGTFQHNLQLQSYQKALSISKKIYGEKNPDLAQNYGRLAKYYLNKKQFKTAIRYSNLAVNACKPTAKVVLLESYQLQGEIQLAAFQYFKNEKYLSSAYEIWQLAIQTVEDYQVEFQRQLARMKLLQLYEPVFDKAIETAFLLYERKKEQKYAKQAFLWSEKSKTINAKLGLDFSVLDKDKHFVNEELIERLKHLEKQQLQFEHLININVSTHSKQTIWNDSLNFYKHSVLILKTKLEQQFPAYYQLVYNTNVETTASLQEFLMYQFDINTAIVAFYSGKNWIYNFTISKRQFYLHRTKKDNTFSKQLSAFAQGLQTKGTTDFNAPAYFLYQNLLQTSLQKLTNTEAIQRLVIIPDGLLYLIPFEALVAKPPTKNTLNPSFLLMDYIVTYEYSATQLIKKHEYEHQKKARKMFAAFAPLEFQNNQCDNEPLIDLVEFQDQIKNISASFPNSRSFLGKRATANRFHQNSRSYQMLFLFTHACNTSNATPNLFFSDTSMTTIDLYTLDLKAELAILCACGTGIGANEYDDGLMSMAHGFFEAGVPSVLASLWSVSAEMSIDLVEKFTQYIQEGYPKDVALQKAKQDFILNGNLENRHPYQWAGFIHIGKTTPIPYFQRLYWLKVAVFIGITAFLSFVAFRFRKHF